MNKIYVIEKRNTVGMIHGYLVIVMTAGWRTKTDSQRDTQRSMRCIETFVLTRHVDCDGGIQGLRDVVVGGAAGEGSVQELTRQVIQVEEVPYLASMVHCVGVFHEAAVPQPHQRRGRSA